MTETFTARTRTGETVTLKVKGDISKLDDLDPLERLPAMMKMFPNPTKSARSGCSFNDIMAKAEDDDGDDDRDREDDLASHPLAQLAQLLVAAGDKPNTSAALHHLLNTRYGGALLHRTRAHKAERESQPMTSHVEFVRDVVKQYGVTALCKSMVQDQKSYGLTEIQLVDLITEEAQAKGQTFEELYKAESVWRACSLAKFAETSPVSAVPNTDTAYNELMVKAEQLRTAHPELSAAQAFSKVFTDPANIELAKRERIESAPR